MIAPVTQNSSVNCITPVLSMTPASVLAPVPFPQLSPLIRCYHPIIPSPCALGQQVIAYCSVLLFYHVSCPYHLAIASSYAIVSNFLLSCSLYCLRTLIVITYIYYW